MYTSCTNAKPWNVPSAAAWQRHVYESDISSITMWNARQALLQLPVKKIWALISEREFRRYGYSN
jgi:hypothetical protein